MCHIYKTIEYAECVPRNILKTIHSTWIWLNIYVYILIFTQTRYYSIVFCIELIFQPIQVAVSTTTCTPVIYFLLLPPLLQAAVLFLSGSLGSLLYFIATISIESCLRVLDPIDLLSVMIAAITLDLNHPSISNASLILTQHKTAIMYNDQSVGYWTDLNVLKCGFFTERNTELVQFILTNQPVENAALTSLFTLLGTSRCNFLKNMAPLK